MGSKKKINQQQQTSLILQEGIGKKILLFRGHKVMLGRDLAQLYGVPTKSLNLAVKRNLRRFPKDFMFQLTKKENGSLRFQFETSKGRGGTRYLPYVFTEHGILMLSSVLNSEQAIQMNIAIMRVFVRIREILATHKELAHRLEILEKKMETKDKEVRRIFEAVRQLINEPESVPEKPKKKMGFHT